MFSISLIFDNNVSSVDVLSKFGKFAAVSSIVSMFVVPAMDAPSVEWRLHNLLRLIRSAIPVTASNAFWTRSSAAAVKLIALSSKSNVVFPDL